MNARRVTTWRKNIAFRTQYVFALANLKPTFVKDLWSDLKKNWFRKLYYYKCHIKISAQYLVPFFRYDSKREPHYFYYGDSCTFWLSQKGKNMGRVQRKIGWLYISLLLGMKTENVIKMAGNKVVTNTSRKKKSTSPFNLEVQFVRIRLWNQY